MAGESGAGKTESFKRLIQFISHAARSRAFPSPHAQDERVPLESMLVQTLPLLESFGNAATEHNPNSSRFGKYVILHFQEVCKALLTLIQCPGKIFAFGAAKDHSVWKSADAGRLPKCTCYLLASLTRGGILFTKVFTRTQVLVQDKPSAVAIAGSNICKST